MKGRETRLIWKLKNTPRFWVFQVPPPHPHPLGFEWKGEKGQSPAFSTVAVVYKSIDLFAKRFEGMLVSQGIICEIFALIVGFLSFMHCRVILSSHKIVVLVPDETTEIFKTEV